MTSFGVRFIQRDPAIPVLITSDGVNDYHMIASSRPAPELGAGVSLALAIRSTASLIRTLVALDGYASKLLFLSADLEPDLLVSLAGEASCTRIITDRDDFPEALDFRSVIDSSGGAVTSQQDTAWLMTTSGTTGRPKIVRHGIESLSRTVRLFRHSQIPPVWGLTYEATRFAGMQVLLQSVLGGGILVVPDFKADINSKIALLAKYGCTHLSATPTLWRQMLMHPSSDHLNLRQITLGGEISDQPVLDALRARYPSAQITHIFASTETGVGFSVKDGLEGFPASFLDEGSNGVALKIANGHLWVRPPGQQNERIGRERLNRDDEGFTDTEDRVMRQEDRVKFLGRDNGAVNVGGTKVYPEAVERIINMLPQVALSRVTSRRNPLSGAILVADVVPRGAVDDPATFRLMIVQHCRTHLPREAVPALVRLNKSLNVNAAGKLLRG